MSFMPVFFLTDILILLLAIGVIIFAIYVSYDEQLRATWLQVIKQPVAVSALVVLLCYTAIGIMDSVRFKPLIDNQSNTHDIYSADTMSLLDLLLFDLKVNTERTYSMPLATHSYTKNMVEENNRQQYSHERLVYAGKHLDNIEDDYYPDLIWRIIIGLFSGLLISGGLISLTIITIKSQTSFYVVCMKCLNNEYKIPWYAVILSITTIIILISVIYQLADGYHVLGTDKVGQDILYQSLKSIRTGVVIGTLTTIITFPLAIFMGLTAGYFGGWIDDIIQYIYTTLNSIPSVLLVAAMILLLQVYIENNAEQFDNLAEQADLRLLFLCMVLGVTSWTGLCRLLRAEALKLREIDYVHIAMVFGVSPLTILLRHLLPNVMHIVIITIIIDFSGLVLAESFLSYINIGVDPSMNSWGNMINQARLEMAREPIVWWPLVSAFVFMFILVLSANLFADAVRDSFDPHLRVRG